ncbi:hypothetical protein CIW49_17365 [Mycolicibacterium sp. P1-18]|uniref:hypothetical protein n=1 Tax=Mycolicibacterium sp. P1-18 TaxID=2024615 RepID=UPI0011F3CCFA|nr:hypothetical protein [Mycolicibacterium sp. P1-18]KAA0097622.1 hypothetical protein CIW49_17365 [Mycolicibacterium sp. P1-18]
MADTLRFTLHQQITLWVNRYTVQGHHVDGATGTVVAYAEQKRMTMRKQVTFYADDARTDVLFGYAAREGLQHGGAYDVTDADGLPIGEFRKDVGRSLLRSTWNLSSGQGLTAVGQERSRGVALARRFLDLVGVVDPLRYHFDFVTDDGQIVLTSEREPTLRDVYEITIPVLSDGRQLDWRVGVAMAVALDALQKR